LVHIVNTLLIFYKINPITGFCPIHHAVQNLVVQNIKILLEADTFCANQTLNFDKMPLHLVAGVVDDTNIQTVFKIIQLFSKFRGNFSWPACKSDNQTPFSMLLEKFATLQNKATCLKIIRYLIERYPKIDKYQKERCAELIGKHFEEVFVDYQNQVVGNWKEEAEENIMDWKQKLADLMEENQAEFLLQLDFLKKSNLQELKDYLSEEDLIYFAIELGRLESFAEIFEIIFDRLDNRAVVQNVLELNRHRILKYIINHDSVKHIEPYLMEDIIMQMKDQRIDINPHTLRCFHILLDHPKFNVNAFYCDNKRSVIVFASSRSEYATIELLKKGASLGVCYADIGMSYVGVQTLKKFFDLCITTFYSEEKSDTFNRIIIDYSFLKASEEMPSIEYLMKKERLQPFLEHPVIISFLFLKWLRLSNIFYLNLLLFSVNAITFCFYLFYIFVAQDHPSSTNNEWLQLLKILAYGSFVTLTVREIFQCFGDPKSYLQSIENYDEITLICMMAITLFSSFESQSTRRSIAALMFLEFALHWTSMLSNMPIFSSFNYNMMMHKVVANFVRTILFYSVILFSFALSFSTLLNFDNSSGNSTTIKSNETDESKKSDASNDFSVWSTLYYVILMLTGDFGKISEGVKDMILGRLILVVFIISMTIVFMNLLVGLTVSDTAAIERDAERNKLCERVVLLAKYERMAWNW
jgi:hypothetical protein